MALRASSFLLALCTPGIALFGQTTSNVQGTNPAPVVRANPPSAAVQPSLDILKQALGEINLDKWKASTAIRTEAVGNLQSIQRDLQTTLPPLLAAGDAAPDSTAKTLPVFRNIDALYDVMLRLDAAGRLAAPKEQISALDQALSSLSDARHALGDQVQANADAQEARVNRLQAALKAVPPPTPPPAAVTCPPAPTRKTRKATPAAKPKPSN
jgi:hypothetical protein